MTAAMAPVAIARTEKVFILNELERMWFLWVESGSDWIGSCSESDDDEADDDFLD